MSLWISTVYLRYHYLVDVLAGLILAPPCFALANWLFRRWGEVRFSLAIPTTWRTRALGLSPPQDAAGNSADIKDCP